MAENRVVKIREIIGCDSWQFVLGKINPIDIPTRSDDLSHCKSRRRVEGLEFLMEGSVILPMFEFDKYHLIGEADEECSKHGKLMIQR